MSSTLQCKPEITYRNVLCLDNLVAYLQDNISEELRSCVLSTELHKQVIYSLLMWAS